MKTLKFLILLLAVLPLVGGTLLSPAQVRPGPVDSVFVTASGLTGWVKLGDHKIEMVAGELVFSNTGGGSGGASWVQRIELVGSPLADWVLLNPVVADSLDVVRNGLTLSPGLDYNLTGNTVSFLGGQVPQTGNVLRFKYQTP